MGRKPKALRTTSSGDRAIRQTVVAAVGLVSATASYVSYSHGWELAHNNGESASRAWAYPLTLDGLILSASMVILRASRHNLPAPKAAWSSLIVGIAGTLFANVMHGVPYGWIGMMVSAWPAIALVLSFEMLMRLMRPTEQVQVPVRIQPPRVQVDTAPDPVPVQVQAQRAEKTLIRPGTGTGAVSAPVTKSPAVRLVKSDEPVNPDRVPTSNHARGTRIYLDSVARGEPLSQSALARELGMTSRKLAARIISEVNNDGNEISATQATG